MACSIRSATRTLLLGVCLLAASVRTGRADEPAPAGSFDLAKSHFKRGRALQETGAYERAIGEYQAAYALAPLPELLFNIAQCHRLSGNAEQALFYYERYLQSVPEGGASDEARVHVETLRRAPKQPKPPEVVARPVTAPPAQ